MERGRYIDRGELQAALERKKPVTGTIRFTEGYNDAILRIKSMVSKFPGGRCCTCSAGEMDLFGGVRAVGNTQML